MKNKKTKTLSKRERIKILVDTFNKCKITHQDIVDEYNRLTRKYAKKAK